MKYKIILLFLLTSCANHTYSIKNNFSYTGKGFAVVTNQSFDNLDNNKFFVSHNKLKLGTKLKITNPANNVFVETIVRKKIKYDNFYKVLISKDIAEKQANDSLHLLLQKNLI